MARGSLVSVDGYIKFRVLSIDVMYNYVVAYLLGCCPRAGQVLTLQGSEVRYCLVM